MTALRWRTPAVLGLMLGGLFCSSANATVTILGVQYQQDNPYPEYQCWYRYGDYPTTCHSTVVGANAHVFLKNTGTSPVTITDVSLGAYSLNNILKGDATLHDTASIYYWGGIGHEQPCKVACIRNDRHPVQRTRCDSAPSDDLGLLSRRVHVQLPDRGQRERYLLPGVRDQPRRSDELEHHYLHPRHWGCSQPPGPESVRRAPFLSDPRSVTPRQSSDA
jgi:hypothetical protein